MPQQCVEHTYPHPRPCRFCRTLHVPHAPAPPSSMSIVDHYTAPPVCVLHLWCIHGCLPTETPLFVLALGSSRLPAASRRPHLDRDFPTQLTHVRLSCMRSFAWPGPLLHFDFRHSCRLACHPHAAASASCRCGGGGHGEAVGVQNTDCRYGTRCMCGIGPACIWGLKGFWYHLCAQHWEILACTRQCEAVVLEGACAGHLGGLTHQCLPSYAT